MTDATPKTYAIMMLETTVTHYYMHAWPEESAWDAELRLRGYSPEGRAQVEQDVVHSQTSTIQVATVTADGGKNDK